MHDQDGVLRNDYRRMGRIETVDLEDSELAYQLHHTRLNDAEIIERLVNRYSEKLSRWVGILNYYQKKTYPTKDQTLNTLNLILGIAIEHVDQFNGYESVLDWLFAIAYKHASDKGGRLQWKLSLQKLKRAKNNHPATTNRIEQESEFLDRLPLKQRSIIALRYLFDLSIQDISAILNLHASKVHSQLTEIRKQYGMQSNGSHNEAEIEAYADGLLDMDPDELHRFTAHINTCGECQNYASKLYELENRLVEVVNNHWSLPPLLENDQKVIIQQAKREIKQPKVWRKITQPVRQTAWVLGLFIIFIGLAIIFISLTPVEREFPSNIPIQTAAPSFIDLEPGQIQSNQSSREQAASRFLAEDNYRGRRCEKSTPMERDSKIMTWKVMENNEYFFTKPLPDLILSRVK